jgi:metal transporter CNNM
MGVGFCNIDKLQLEVMSMSRNPDEQKMAKTIMEVVSNHHLWLTTLLVYNAMALESLPLVVHTLMPDWAAILFSTFIVLIAA